MREAWPSLLCFWLLLYMGTGYTITEVPWHNFLPVFESPWWRHQALTVMDGFHSLCNKGTFLRQTFPSEMANIRSFKGLVHMYIQAFTAWQHLWDLKTRLEIWVIYFIHLNLACIYTLSDQLWGNIYINKKLKIASFVAYWDVINILVVEYKTFFLFLFVVQCRSSLDSQSSSLNIFFGGRNKLSSTSRFFWWSNNQISMK